MTCRQQRSGYIPESIVLKSLRGEETLDADIIPINVRDLITKSDGRTILDYKNLPMSFKARLNMWWKKLKRL